MKIVHTLRKGVDAIVSMLFAVLVTIVLLQIVFRVFHIQQTWIDEISKFIFVWLTFLGGSVTVSNGQCIAFDLIMEATHGKSYRILFTITSVCSLVFMAAMLVFGTMTAINNMGQYSAMTATNVGLMNLAIPIGCVFMMICQVEYYFNHLHDRDEGEEDTAV